MNKYYLWSAQAYGLVAKDENKFSLTELGRKILAPTRPNEDKEALVQAVLTPVTFSRFFTDYSGSPFPGTEHIGNVLEVRYGIPRERIQEAATLLRENGLFASILQQQADGTMIVRPAIPTSGLAVPQQPAPAEAEVLPEQQSTLPSSVEFSSVCFVITPIGDDESEERRHANMILKSVIEPVASELGLAALRADQISRSGIITQQIFEYLASPCLRGGPINC
jgi:hypothetical protein